MRDDWAWRRISLGSGITMVNARLLSTAPHEYVFEFPFVIPAGPKPVSRKRFWIPANSMPE
ncbi:MAG TPA: hypothetical protein PKV86_01795 [Syntrophobacteraceae bacterium]|nr:hypothetical protein [Syntrophobacteraceae bacterium]